MTVSRLSSRRASIASIKSVIKNVARFRWLIFMLGNIASFANTVIATSLSLTIVAMIEKDPTNSTQLLDANGTSTVKIAPISTGKIHVDWTSVDKDRMLQAGFWGILAISLFSGRICELFGPRKVVSLALAFVGFTNMLFPLIAKHSFLGAYLVKVIQGICAGLIPPSLFVMISRWSTSSERTLSNSVVISGGAIGSLVGLPFAGILVSSSFLGGWPSVFYLFGGLNVIIAIAWYIIIYDTPEEHPYLSAEELEEILSNRTLKSSDKIDVPWRKMLTSLPVIAHLVPSFTYGWISAVVGAQIPSFYEEVLGFSHTANGFLSSLPWLLSTLISILGSTIADKLRRTNRFSTAVIRKTFTLIGLGTVSCGLVAITLLGKRRTAVVLTLSIAKGMGSLVIAGAGANHLDIAPSFAGTLGGFASVLHSLSSLAANEGAAQIVGNETTAQNWYYFFYLSAAINVVGVIVFCLFGSGETQSWDPSSVPKQSNTNNSSLKSQNITKGNTENNNQIVIESLESYNSNKDHIDS
ncbi:sialin-like [Tetranychus urticae]|uniref:sialin-like n=1 Tax=Tetranychus urticae TaxID=32264 RepID=UPI00077BC63A|nr:sialin-like [Tetranychus urticae]